MYLDDDDDDEDDDGDGGTMADSKLLINNNIGPTLHPTFFHHSANPNHEAESVLQALCRKGQVDEAIQILYSLPKPPSDASYLSLLRACHHHSHHTSLREKRIKTHLLQQAKRVKTHIYLHGRPRPLVGLLGGYLVLTLAKCGGIEEAQRISDQLSCRSVFTWTALIFAYAEFDRGHESLSAYHQMVKDKIKPNSFTFVALFKACGSIPNLEQGKSFHALADRHGFICHNVYVGTALLSMYEKCGALKEAEQVFVSLDERNVVSWNVMLSLYVEQGEGEKAIKLYRQMEESGINSDQQTLLFAIQACGILALQKETTSNVTRSTERIGFEIGHALHFIVHMKQLAGDTIINTALLKMYGRCSAFVEAENVFNSLSHRDIVAWTTMLTIYTEQGQADLALELYARMQTEDVSLDDISMICILQGCSGRGSLGICENIHFAIVASGFDENSSVSATLIHAYGNCMRTSDARAIFNKQSDPDVVAWNACISGYAGEGNMQEVVIMFERLKEHIKPNEVTFILVLSACSHCGLVTKGLEYLESMSKNYGLDPNLKHYGIMIDLLGRKGEFKRIMDMVKTMPMQADLTIWLSLLDSCDLHGNIKLAEEVFHHAVSLEPNHATPYVLMSKIYTDAGLKECSAIIDYLRQHTCAYET